ncbi:putative 5-deoxy-glucuronate isomerase [Gordonia polyisoprenivorans VH2]|uniref:Putative 5-deoxy-glucuronate isomerase n=1 Tax=Gordonia polyisoprenivorans (strain DSM 44266 / VH2) TaxID=1112204 RepID=H6N033_GORPV|nr:5-deoxy-glucuronate isomerase [Gordonia polyisoprenivorans]AFA74485.1 putative 5-deoxy-glucuronate isomerase [Gordonia polyisoprenivorans VH2]
MNSKYYVPAGSATAPLSVDVTPESAGWSESSLWVAQLGPGDSITRSSGPNEIIVIPLSGSAVVACDGRQFELEGRQGVFDGPSDFAYVGRDSEFTVTSADGGRFALCGARASTTLPFRYGPRAGVPVELRGAGNCSRQVHNFGTADVFEADSIIACEVITPGGNWSSYPAHKHDENSEVESQLEEIYYFEFSQITGFGYHRVYGTPERPIEVLEEVRSGDVVLVPHGYHGPSIAAPGYHMYYLNVMAGPGPERAWKICDDPAHTWLRGSWEHQEIDPRLPLHDNNSH